MKAAAGKFVEVNTGELFDGYEQDGFTNETITKAGNVTLHHGRCGYLTTWHKRYIGWDQRQAPVYTFDLLQGDTARYDPATEGIASLVRERIQAIQKDLRHERERLHALYAYQAGEKPPDTGVVAQAQEKEAPA